MNVVPDPRARNGRRRRSARRVGLALVSIVLATPLFFLDWIAVRDWIGITADVGKPDPEHKKRPIDGFACTRSEVSGQRLWGLFAERYPKPAVFILAGDI